jgi:hypothetical protein
MPFKSRAMSRTSAAVLLACAYGCYLGAQAGCSSPDPASLLPHGSGGVTDDGDAAAGIDAGQNGALPFFADSPSTYVAKVKYILTGLPPTDAEVSAVTADPTQLGHLVDGWMATPEYQSKMLQFFKLAFQQTQVSGIDYYPFLASSFYPGSWTTSQMLQNNEEVVARTALWMAATEQPFTQTLSTQTYVMTTAMKSFYAFLDVWQYDNNRSQESLLVQPPPGHPLIITDATPIPLSESLDPSSANYMKFYNAKTFASGCHTVNMTAGVGTLYQLEFGAFHATSGCSSWVGDPIFDSQADSADWTPVSIRQPKPGEATTPFFDIPSLRSAKELVLNRPYVGYFTTPAFMANNPTNASNQMRVTMNQAFIVATNAQVDGTDTTVPTAMPGLDPAHASDGAACFNCHRLLDPSRSILSKTFSWNYGTQLDPAWTAEPGRFIFNGVDRPVSSVYDLAQALATHPLVAPGWAQKLCFYVNSEACVTTDPEFQKIVATFQSSKFSWNALVKAVVTSPITTHASSSLTATTNGETVAISRRNHLCAALGVRLGYADLCDLDVTQASPNLNSKADNIIDGLPKDGYARGSTIPVLANAPTLFYRAGLENFCEAVASLVVDVSSPAAGAKTWSSAQPDAAVADFVTVVAGLAPSDPRAAPLEQALKAHFTAVKGQSGTTAKTALQSTFTAACLAPSALAVGL